MQESKKKEYSGGMYSFFCYYKFFEEECYDAWHFIGEGCQNIKHFSNKTNIEKMYVMKQLKVRIAEQQNNLYVYITMLKMEHTVFHF